MERHSQPDPFPGLRPYGPEEEHLFFGRETEIASMLRRLRTHRLLAVIGTSGCGKSSLVRCGLIPSLEGGLMTAAGSSWRVAILRPGEDPIGHLAGALDAPGILDLGHDGAPDLASTTRVLIEATLRRGSLGLVAAARQARLTPGDNLLVIVDQFEELFRFRRNRQAGHPRDEAVAFVKLLLEAARQAAVPIYVALTMRSDFIGDCMEYPGLPDAINQGQYLVPRMGRDALRSVITGPMAVTGGEIAPRLVLRLLNELGDNQDDLPILQHVLMRTWDHWQRHRMAGEPMDVSNYEAVGTLRDALSRHAEEAYAEVGGDSAAQCTARIFRALTDTFTDVRGIRRPTSVAELAAICEAPEPEVMRVVEIFRGEGRSFLMPPPEVPLTSRTIIDISHESLMRGWTRLVAWSQEERASAAAYARLSREASWHAEGAAALWGDPELELGLRWRQENAPTAAWASRFDGNFDAAMAFLDRSEGERTRQRAERRAGRLHRLQIAWGVASVLLVLLVVAIWQGLVARREGRRAVTNFNLATTAVDQLLVSVDRNQASVGADVPQMEQFRRDLLERARRFYDEFIRQQPTNAHLIEEVGFAHFRLGHIYRMLDDRAPAAAEYREAIARFESLAADHPTTPAYRQALANSYNWLAETLRQAPTGYAEAEALYDKALGLQRSLVRDSPRTAAYQQELARTRYNRGILLATADPGDDGLAARAEADFRAAIGLLSAISGSDADGRSRQELARVYNNLAALVSRTDRGTVEARRLYEAAIAIHDDLVKTQPGNREDKFELAKFSNNYAELLRGGGEFPLARASNGRARVLLDDLVRPAPSLGIEIADTDNLRGRILQATDPDGAAAAYRNALDIYEGLDRGGDVATWPAFHLRFGDLLLSLAEARRDQPSAAGRRVLFDAVSFYIGVGRRAAAAGRKDAARSVSDNLDRLMNTLAESDRTIVATARERMTNPLAQGASAR